VGGAGQSVAGIARIDAARFVAAFEAMVSAIKANRQLITGKECVATYRKGSIRSITGER
jgi:hypothetical protein